VGNGDVSEELSEFERLLAELDDSARNFELRVCPPQTEVVSFYLDGPNTPEWRVMIIVGKSRRLFLEPGFFIEPLET